MRTPLFFILLLIPVITYSQKAQDHASVVNALAQKIAETSFSKKPVHLAIVPFVPTQGNGTVVNTYGDYLTESIIGKMSENTSVFKTYERKRLDAILKENELMLSGMMKPSEALKIGELLPIDVLFSGTYTKLKSYIDVSGRLIDVTSGEILMSFSGRVKLTKNIKTLFGENEDEPATTTTNIIIANNGSSEKGSANTVTKPDMETICKQKTDNFSAKLHDLSTTEKVNTLVNEGMKTPFENNCGKLHYYLIDALARYNLQQEGYKKFLLSTLDTIAFPSEDDRAYSILSYLTKDGVADEAEWKSGFIAVKKIGNYTLSTYLGFLLGKINEPDLQTRQKRIDLYFNELNKGLIGLPRPIDYNKGFFEMMEALGGSQPLRLYTYEKYSNKVVTESELVVSTHLMYLKRMYEEENDPALKSKVMTWITDYFNKHTNKKSPEQLYEFAYDFEIEPNQGNNHYITERNTERLTKFPASDLNILIQRCRDKFSNYAVQTPYPSQKEDRINFCVRHSIPVAGEIPSIAEAETILRGNNINEQLKIMKLLVQMGEHVRPLEKTFIALLDKRSLDDKETLLEVQSIAIEILGKLRSIDTKAIDHMVARITSYNYKESDSAKEALIAIGKPAVKSLLSKLNATTIHDGGLQYQLVVILGKIGKDAKPAEASLKNLLAKSSNTDVRYAIKASLQAINE
jgi:TolB-like protein